VQQQSFPSKIQNISSKPSGLPLVRQLRLFIGVIHCGRRIHNVPVSELMKFPYLLPMKHPFYQNHHNMQSMRKIYILTLTGIKQSPGTRQLIWKLLKNCEGKPPYQMPDPLLLVKCRVQEIQPSRKFQRYSPH